MEENSITRDFFEIMTSYSYLPTIFRPTRVTSYTATLIDNCFINNYEHSADSGILITDISDHLPIFHISDLKARNHIPVSQNKYFISRQIDKLTKKALISSKLIWVPLIGKLFMNLLIRILPMIFFLMSLTTFMIKLFHLKKEK